MLFSVFSVLNSVVVRVALWGHRLHNTLFGLEPRLLISAPITSVAVSNYSWTYTSQCFQFLILGNSPLTDPSYLQIHLLVYCAHLPRGGNVGSLCQNVCRYVKMAKGSEDKLCNHACKLSTFYDVPLLLRTKHLGISCCKSWREWLRNKIVECIVTTSWLEYPCRYLKILAVFLHQCVTLAAGEKNAYLSWCGPTYSSPVTFSAIISSLSGAIVFDYVLFVW